MTDTIFAIASGAGRAAIAVMRLSGPGSAAAVRALAGQLPGPRRASLRRLRDAAGQELDQALVLWLPGPSSFTGEDSAEFHLHAGPAVLDGVAAALVATGARPAEPGEFTRRAVLNGRLELTQAEAIVDLIAAETEAQRAQALRQMDGALRRLLDGWSSRLRAMLVRAEARLDFPDETSGSDESCPDAALLATEIQGHLGEDRGAERLRAGLVFVVTGPPNAGKSSLVNALAGRDVAIVSPVPGTTRDLIEARAVFGGVPITLIDTAGLRDSDDPVEREGVRRAREQANRADLVIAVTENGRADVLAEASANTILVWSKVDLAPPPAHRLGISVVTGAGFATLVAALDQAAQRLTRSTAAAPLTRARHRAACRLALDHLRAAATAPAEELRAEELRLAMAALGRVTGHVGVEQVLDDVFSGFCIGK